MCFRSGQASLTASLAPLAAAVDADTIEIDAGTYLGDTCVIARRTHTSSHSVALKVVGAQRESPAGYNVRNPQQR